MTIILTPQQEELINQRVAEGDFSNASEVIDVALRLFLLQQYEDPLPPEELRRELAIAVEQEARGEFGPIDAEAIKAEGRRLLAMKQGRK